MAALFDIKTVSFPTTIKTKTDFKVTGEITLISLPYYFLPLWVVCTITYPKGWLDLLGANQTSKTVIAWFGKFSADFPQGFSGEGDYTLDVRAFLGPTEVLSEKTWLGGVNATIPPLPSMVVYPQQKFNVAGQGGVGVTSIKQSVVYNNSKTQVNSGQPVTAVITWQNTATTAVQPQFRVDIQGTGTFDSPLEGNWITSPSVAAGATATISVPSVPIPTDWQNGKQLNAYVMLNGVSGHWDSSPLLTVYVPGSVVGAVTKQSVVYNNNVATVQSGQPVSVQITWKNTGTASVQPQFRVDIQGTSLLDSVLEGTWVTAPAVAVGGTVTVNVSSVAIPTDWQNGKQLNAYVMLNGVSGHWDTSGLLTVVKGVVTVTPTVTMSSTNYIYGTQAAYAFNGFQPNAQIYATIQGQGSAIDYPIADANGNGTSYFLAYLDNGSYTLVVTDNFGHSATATFSVSGQPVGGLYSFSVQIVNAGAAFAGATHWWAYYYDPVTGAVSDSQWHPISASISFTNVNNDGWLAVFLYNSSTGQTSGQISSAPIPLVASNMNLIFDASTGGVTSQ